ncbi:ArsR family transcriptional regulator [Psychromonas sp. SR45-3]|uniref:ArsR family transcriptional regulator n=1 Tax=Psychromonas sp. SR45-3 TaxID=2760930 RepID=UPI0015FE43AA|nr:ArsR family transcriptional regulator [Psychromonas sp. SR45-3]MBB1273495.1 ArsR family transcriptional regulator [Psychromonas sp. SR45-3]
MKVSNPLTIIAIFAGTAEAFATGALIALPPEIQSKFVYFVMLFPLLIVLIFFGVLIFKHHVLYAPSDFDDQADFLLINNIKKAVANATEKAILDATASGKEIDPKKVAESTIEEMESSLTLKVLNYLTEHPNEAFTSRGLAHILSTSTWLVNSTLYDLEGTDYIKKGKDGTTLVWQIKT